MKTLVEVIEMNDLNIEEQIDEKTKAIILTMEKNLESKDKEIA